MTASKIFLRDLLGLLLILSYISVVLAILLDVLALLTHFSHEDVIAHVFFYESLPLYICVVPVVAIGRYINRPNWVSAVLDYQLNMAKKSG